MYHVHMLYDHDVGPWTMPISRTGCFRERPGDSLDFSARPRVATQFFVKFGHKKSLENCEKNGSSIKHACLIITFGNIGKIECPTNN